MKTDESTAGKALRFGFDASVPQTEPEVDEALKGGLLSLDANVLLNFYRYSPKARDALVAVLEAAGDRVWVSHQAAREFWRNRCAAIDSRSQATEQLRTAIDKNGNAALNAVDVWVKQTAVSEETKQQVIDALAEGLNRARDLIEAEVQGAGTITYDGSRDTVLTTLTDLLSKHVGPPLPEDQHEVAIAEGARRAEAKHPPGYLDAEKAEAGGRDGASGDYLVWLQSITEAKRRDLSLVIVTGDEKEDWWWKHRNHFMGPRQELVQEFSSHSKRRLFMLRPVQLIDHAAALHVAVSADAAADVARASAADEAQDWTMSAVLELLRRLEGEGWPHAQVIRVAAELGGVIDRDQVYAIAGYDEDRMLRGFTRPTARITRDLQEEGLLASGVEAALTADYAGGVTAVGFEIPPVMVELLGSDGQPAAR